MTKATEGKAVYLPGQGFFAEDQQVWGWGVQPNLAEGYVIVQWIGLGSPTFQVARLDLTGAPQIFPSQDMALTELSRCVHGLYVWNDFRDHWLGRAGVSWPDHDIPVLDVEETRVIGRWRYVPEWMNER